MRALEQRVALGFPEGCSWGPGSSLSLLFPPSPSRPLSSSSTLDVTNEETEIY